MKYRGNSLKKITIIFFIISIIFFVIFLGNLTPGLKGSIDQELRIYFKQTDRIISYSIKDTLRNILIGTKNKYSNEIKYEKLELNISFQNYEILKNERKKALKEGINRSRTKVPITIRFNGKKFAASARLKGVLSDHYGNNKQFSLRIRLKKGNSIKGMKEFDLVQHKSRQFPKNVFYSKILSNLEIASPEFYTFKISLNGDDWGLMLAEEQYSDAYFELRKKKYAPVFKFSNEDDNDIYRILSKDLDMKNKTKVQFINYLTSKHGVIENNYYNKRDFQNEYYINSISYLKNIKYDLIKNKVGISNLEKIFDMDKFSKLYILSIVLGEYHQFNFRNIRFYLNPFTLKMEPIPTDLGSPLTRELKNEEQLKKELYERVSCDHGCRVAGYIIYDQIIKNTEFQKHFRENLDLFSKTLKTSKPVVDDLCEFQIDCSKKINFEIIDQNFEKLKNETNYIKIFNLELFNDNELSTFTKINEFEKKYFEIIENPIYARVFSDGKIKAMNLTQYPLKINSISLFTEDCFEKEFKDLCKDTIKKEFLLESDDFVFNILELGLNLDKYKVLKIDVTFDGNNLKSSQFEIENQKHFETNNIIKNLNEFKSVNNNLIFDKKEIYIDKPIILPLNQNLKISAGTKIYFGENSYLELNGGKIEALGSENEKIYFLPYDSSKEWNGILVKNAKQKSVFNHVVFENVNHFKTKNSLLTGGINFYKSDVDFLNTKFKDTTAEDFLNITSSKFKIINSQFINCLSDAFDSDFSTGVISDTEYFNIKGDAADFSGSKVLITDSKFKNIDDKGISAGERSSIESIRNNFIESNISIASKDDSKVIVVNNNFLNSESYDLIAFRKKSFYDFGGQINVSSEKDIKNYSAKSDFLSKIVINNNAIKNSKIDLKDLY